MSFLQWLIYKRKREDFQPRRICVYRIGNVGDLLCTIPALWQIRHKYPMAKITLLSSPGKRGGISAESVLSGIKCLDDIQLYYNDEVKDWKGCSNLRRRLQKMEFDYLIQIPPMGARLLRQIRNLVFFRLVGFKVADGFYTTKLDSFMRTQMLNDHAMREAVRCVKQLPFANDGKIEFVFDATLAEKEKVRRVLQDKGVLSERPLLAISFAGKDPAKKWPHENFSDLAGRWIRKRHGVVAIIGGRAEKSEAEIILQGISDKERSAAVNLCGEFSICESLSFLSDCDVLVSIDTGTAHMSSITGTPCIDLCSAYNLPNYWFAYGENVKIIRKDLPCAPCGRSSCPRAEYGVCMQAITVDEVWQKVLGLR